VAKDGEIHIIGHDSDAAEPSDSGSAKHFVDSLVGYRSLKRRFELAARQGVDVPFFEPRDGVSGSIIRRQGRDVINYSGYNYLGLSGHPEVSQAAKDAIDRYGTSASASRIVSGQIDLHGELERKLAAFLGTEDALAFVSGYLTNVTVISHLFGKGDAVIHDNLAHSSIMTGARLSGAHLITYPNDDWSKLDDILTARRSEFRRVLLVCEGVYSMDGQVLDLRRAVEAKQRHDLVLMVDEAHSAGTIGETGRGVCEGAGLPPSVIDIHMGTLSKALAGTGGYVAGDRRLIEYLRYLAPGFIFSVGLSPPDTAAAIAALEILQREPERTEDLRQRALKFRQLARAAGLKLEGDAQTPIASLIVGDDNMCMMLSRRLLAHDIYVQPIVHPAVPLKMARLRFFITRDHTEEQFKATIPVLARDLERLHAQAR
jgi:8-amino-7-oxononanoate synthase